MITSTTSTATFRLLGIAALFFTAPANAQQLYSDSAVAVMTQEKLCMVLPDSGAVTSVNSTFTEPILIDMSAISVINQSWIPQCGECFTYNFSHINFSSLFVTPAWTGCCVAFPPLPPGVYVVSEPIGAECQIGIAGASETGGVRFAAYIAHAALQLSALVPDSVGDSSSLT